MKKQLSTWFCFVSTKLAVGYNQRRVCFDSREIAAPRPVKMHCPTNDEL